MTRAAVVTGVSTGIGRAIAEALVGAGWQVFGSVRREEDAARAAEALGAFSRESFMWLGQLVFMLMCALVAIGMSAPLITRLFGPPSNVQTSYYNLVNAPLAIAMGLLLGIAPLLRWRQHEPGAFVQAALPALGEGVACEYCAARGLCRRDHWAPPDEGGT